MELYYKRVESVRKGRVHPARTQTVVVFLPDVRSCLPTRFEWDELTIKYKKRLEMKLQSDHSGSVDREIIDRVEKKSHQDESETANKDGGGEGAGDGDIEMADEPSNKLETSTVVDGDKQSKASDATTDATKATGAGSSGEAAATSSATSKALHKNIITNKISHCILFSLFGFQSLPNFLPLRFVEAKLNCVIWIYGTLFIQAHTYFIPIFPKFCTCHFN